MTKPHICFVGPMLGRNRNWVPNPMETLAPHLAARGYSCTLTSTIVNKYRRLLDIVQTILRRHGEFDAICIQVYSGPSFVVEDIASWLCQFFKKPVVMMLHGGSMPEFMARYPRWSRRVLGRAQILVTPSAYLSQAVQPHGFTARIIPNLLTLQDYPFRHRLTVRPALIWMRTFYGYYRPDLAVEVLAHLHAEYPEATLTMAGQDKGLLPATQALVKKLGLEQHVRFPGMLDAAGKQREFAQHDLFLNTTQIDNMPICLLEAGAFGTPIVSTNVGGVPYLVQDGQTALLTPPDDVAAMSRAVCRLIQEPGLAARLSQGGRAIAEGCAAERIVPLWEQVFCELIGRQ
jgi:glycosyltransferase involved in cell wall biosynthesis